MTGKGLNVLIECDYLPHHHWMVLSSWYSLYKNLPDAKVFIYCKRQQQVYYELFKWAVKLRANFSYNRPKTGFDLIIDSTVVAVEGFNGDLKIVEAKTKDFGSFVSYKNGCGNFVLAQWINKVSAPFGMVEKLGNVECTVNEKKVLEVWRSLIPIYSIVGTT